jgi:hypothetical protein
MKQLEKISNYIKKAQQRATRRKHPLNILLLLVGFVFWLAYALLILKIGMKYYAWLHPESPILTLKNFENIGHAKSIVTSLLPLFASIPIGLISANFLFYVFPAARRIFDVESNGFSETDFISSQKGLLKIIFLITIPCLVLFFILMSV